jgi:hypothetical protein
MIAFLRSLGMPKSLDFPSAARSYSLSATINF